MHVSEHFRLQVRARSKFWYFLRKLKKVKKANGQIIAVNEIFEVLPTVVKNYGIWIRYQSRTGYHNMYKEYRDVTLNGAVEQMYVEMAGRHRVRAPCLQIIKVSFFSTGPAFVSFSMSLLTTFPFPQTATVPNELCKRENTMQFHDAAIKFPLTRKLVRPSSKSLRTTFKYVRPSVAM